MWVHTSLRFGCFLTVALATAPLLYADTPDGSVPSQVTLSATAASELEYFSVDAGKLIAGFDKSRIVSDPPILKASFYQMTTAPRIIVPAGCEAYLLTPALKNNEYKGYRIVGRKPRGKAIQGDMYLLRRHPDQPRESVLAKLDFSVPATSKLLASSDDFHLAKGQHYQTLWSNEYAGSALFRHLAIQSMSKVGKQAKSVGTGWPQRRDEGVNSTISMMAGGRAISENLALDNELDDPKNYLGELVDLSTVRGVTVREIDWKPRLSKKETQLDPLAKLIPHDQYAVYLPSFETLTQLIDRGSELATPLVHWFEPQSRKTDVLGFYQEQLAVPLNGLTRQVGNTLIDEVAITGSDPYFRTGTDLAVLIRSKQAGTLHQAITALITAQTANDNRVKRVDHKVDGATFSEWSTPTRELCSFVAVKDDTVIISNSMHQIIQVLKCSNGNVESMHGLDEYKYFRQRYVRDTKNPAALVVITDAAIRRWCGPTWRISASRRTRARATIAEATMQHADALLSGSIESDTVFHRDSVMPKAGTITLTKSGVLSQEYGTLNFQTPISEMKLWRATKKEVDLYSRWRTSYERKWRRAFDPIAVQIKVSEKELSADLTVIPLVLTTQYRQYQQIIGKMRLKPGAGDHHKESLAALDIAIDTNAPIFLFARSFLQGQNNGLNIDPFGWIDGSASIYFDYDEEWMKRLDNRDPWEFGIEDVIQDIPVALHIPSKNSLQLTTFVAGLRSFLNSSAPNMIVWGTKQYKGLTYVTVRPGSDEPGRAFYITLPEGITLSGNEKLIQRVIDRHLARKKKLLADGKDKSAEDRPEDTNMAENQNATWSADPSKLFAPQIVMNITGDGARAMLNTNFNRNLHRTHRIAWSNLPILNYFRNRYPDRDPFTVYHTLFGQTLREPTGGEYQWDANRSTYVSSHHGYHLEPKAGPQFGPEFGTKDHIGTTISFQDGGLRATLTVKEK